jgi:hypothetical protein
MEKTNPYYRPLGDIEFKRFERTVKARGLRKAINGFLAAYDPRKDGLDSAILALVDGVAQLYGLTGDRVRSMDRCRLAIAARHDVWLRLTCIGYSPKRIAEVFQCQPRSIVAGRELFRTKYADRAAEIEGVERRATSAERRAA